MDNCCTRQGLNSCFNLTKSGVPNAVVYVTLPSGEVVVTTTNGEGEYTLELPYAAGEQGATVEPVVVADGFDPSALPPVVLAVPVVANDTDRYAWMEPGRGAKLTGWCHDLTTRSWVHAKHCAVQKSLI